MGIDIEDLDVDIISCQCHAGSHLSPLRNSFLQQRVVDLFFVFSMVWTSFDKALDIFFGPGCICCRLMPSGSDQ